MQDNEDEQGPATPTARQFRSAKAAPTIYDIAELAGVNPSTVSRALTKPGRISAKTEERIHAAAKSLNYRVNPFARALPTGRTNTLGLIVADITNPMFFHLFRGAERETTEQNYTLVLAEFRESAETEMLTAKRLMPQVDGVILATTRLGREQIIELSEEKPVVVINRQIDVVPCVVADVEPGVAAAVAHLRELGHRKVVYVSGPERAWVSQHRWASIQRHCSSAGITAVCTPSMRPVVEAGPDAAAAVMASGATAVIAYNDLLAIGLMLTLVSSSVRVPGDISVIGFDNIFGSDFTSPPLTTIRAPQDNVGLYAARRMFEVLGGLEESAGRTQDLATALILRGSTGPAPRM